MNFIITKEQYQVVKAAWKSSKEHTAAELLIYNLLRGFPLERGFTPFKEESKNKIISHNNDRWNGYNMALRGAGNSLFIRDVSDEFYLKKYGSIKKPSFVARILSQDEPVVELPDYAKYYRQRDIAENEQSKNRFQTVFGLEFTAELSALLLAALKDKEKK